LNEPPNGEAQRQGMTGEIRSYFRANSGNALRFWRAKPCPLELLLGAASVHFGEKASCGTLKQGGLFIWVLRMS